MDIAKKIAPVNPTINILLETKCRFHWLTYGFTHLAAAGYMSIIVYFYFHLDLKDIFKTFITFHLKTKFLTMYFSTLKSPKFNSKPKTENHQIKKDHLLSLFCFLNMLLVHLKFSYLL